MNNHSPIANLLSDLPSTKDTETFEKILSGGNFRLERIVSNGQRSPDGFWYDQDQDEWVLVLLGSARIRIEGETNDRVLQTGDHLLVRAHDRHRVEWTDSSQPTIWLAGAGIFRSSRSVWPITFTGGFAHARPPAWLHLEIFCPKRHRGRVRIARIKTKIQIGLSARNIIGANL